MTTPADTRAGTLARVDPDPPGGASGEEMLFEIDGPDVHPANIDAVVLLELAASFFSLVAAEAASTGAELRLDGLAIRDKCAAVVTWASDGLVARQAADQTRQVLSGASDPPKGASGYVQRFRQAAQRLDSEKYQLRAMGTAANRAWQLAIAIPAETRTRPLDSLTTIRVRVERAGGVAPAVRFSSIMERVDFTLRANEAMAQEIGKHLYKEGDLEARVERGLDGEIIGGQVLNFRPLDADCGDPWVPWMQWFQSVAQE